MSKPTIHDVAREAGVSIKTVSRVLNGEPKASQATREKVLAAISALDYSPNLSARSLSAARNYMIAFVFGTIPGASEQSLQHEYMSGLLVGAVETARAAGFHLLVEPLDLAPEGFKERAARLAAMPAVDGFIIAPGLADDPAFLAEISRRRGCFVRVSPGVEVPGLPAMVRIDDYRAAQDMTCHLLALGHRRIAFIGGKPGFGSAEQRLQAFEDEMNRAGCFDPSLLHAGDYAQESGRLAALQILAATELPTAVFAANDSMAIGFMAEAHRRGLRIPQDISIAGIDDIRMASSVWPALTTVRQPIVAMGMAASRYIVEASRQSTPPPVPGFFSHELIIRESTAAPRNAR